MQHEKSGTACILRCAASFLCQFLIPRRRPRLRRLISIRSRGIRHFAAVSMRPPLRIPLSRLRFMPVPTREWRAAHSSLRWKRASSSWSPFVPRRWRVECMSQSVGGFHKRRYFRAMRPYAVGHRLIYSDRKNDGLGIARCVPNVILYINVYTTIIKNRGCILIVLYDF